MDGLGGRPHAFGHALRGASRRGGENDAEFYLAVNLDERTDNRRLAHARAARDNRELVGERPFEGLVLLDGEREAGAAFPPRDGLLDIEGTEVAGRIENRPHTPCRAPFAEEERARVDAARHGLALYGHAVLGDFRLQGGGENLDGNPRQLIPLHEEFVLIRPAVSAILRLLLKGVGNRRPCANRRIFRDADRERNAVGSGETDAPDVAAEPVGVGLHDGDCVRPVFPDDFRHLRNADAVGLPKDHVLAHRLIRVPTLANLRDFRRAQLRHFPETRRLIRQHVERILAERLHDALRQNLADAAYQTRREILLDPVQRLRGHAGDVVRLELPPVHLVRHPLTFGADVLALPDGLGLADDRNLVQPTQGITRRQFDVKHRVAVFLVVVDDRANRALHRLDGGLHGFCGFLRRLHAHGSSRYLRRFCADRRSFARSYAVFASFLSPMLSTHFANFSNGAGSFG